MRGQISVGYSMRTSIPRRASSFSSVSLRACDTFNTFFTATGSCTVIESARHSLSSSSNKSWAAWTPSASWSGKSANVPKRNSEDTRACTPTTTGKSLCFKAGSQVLATEAGESSWLSLSTHKASMSETSSCRKSGLRSRSTWVERMRRGTS